MILPTPETTAAIADKTGLPPGVANVLLPFAVVVAGYFAGVGLELLLGRVLRSFAARSATRLDDILLDAFRGPVRVFSTLVAGALAIMMTPAPEGVRIVAERLIIVLLVLAGVAVAARMIGGVVVTYGERARLVGSTRWAIRRVAVIAIWLVGALFVLDNQGVSIAPLLTTMGLAGLAAALAFQDTLSNFFAGIYVQADRPLDIGHYVRLEDLNVEGYVVDVGWRTTKIRTLPNNIVVIPNARIASSVVTDFDLPEPRMSLLIRVPVVRSADPRRVEKLLIDEATKAADKIPGLLKEPAPFVRFIPGFTDIGMEFTLICQVEKFVDQYLAQHELRYLIVERFRSEGIEMPYPVRALRAEGPAPEAGAVLVPARAPRP